MEIEDIKRAEEAIKQHQKDHIKSVAKNFAGMKVFVDHSLSEGEIAFVVAPDVIQKLNEAGYMQPGSGISLQEQIRKNYE